MATERHDDDVRICPVGQAHVADLIQLADANRLSPWSARSYLDEMKNPDSLMLRLVSGENETIGFIVGRLPLEAEIYNIAVAAGHKGRGRGQLLLDHFLTEAAKRCVQSVWLEVRESNTRAIRFYKKNGFERVQSRPNFYSDPREHAILMRLELPRPKS